ncbi:MAG: phosphotransferase [Candidatus Delongbacteria bacterium]
MKDILKLCRDEGYNHPEITRLKGDYSERKIYRVSHKSGTFIAVISDNTAENDAFLSFRDSFERAGFKVPAFIAVSDDRNTYFIEDLGDMTVKSYCYQRVAAGDISDVKNIYSRIISLLWKIQTVMYNEIDYSKCYQGLVFDSHAMEKDISRFEEYFLKKYHKNYDPAKFAAFREKIISEADRQKKDFFMYRDFQSRNIMFKNNELYFIDFQSGRRGSFYYDLASFLYSSNTINYEGMEKELSEVYFNSSKHINADFEEFIRLIKIFACLRIMQSAGNYAFYYFTRGDTTIKWNYPVTLSKLRCLSKDLGFYPFI